MSASFFPRFRDSTRCSKVFCRASLLTSPTPHPSTMHFERLGICRTFSVRCFPQAESHSLSYSCRGCHVSLDVYVVSPFFLRLSCDLGFDLLRDCGRACYSFGPVLCEGMYPREKARGLCLSSAFFSVPRFTCTSIRTGLPHRNGRCDNAVLSGM